MCKFIVFEGPDGAGKTTVLKDAFRYYRQGDPTVKMKAFDHGVEWAWNVGDHLQQGHVPGGDPAVLAMLSALSATAVEVRRLLDKGTYVLMDRWEMSTYVYQVAAPYAGGPLNPEPLRRYLSISRAIGLPQPDLYLVFDAPDKVLDRRIGVKPYTARGPAEKADRKERQAVREAYRQKVLNHFPRVRYIDTNQDQGRSYMDADYYIHAVMNGEVVL